MSKLHCSGFTINIYRFIFGSSLAAAYKVIFYMTIYNLAFITERLHEAQLKEWLRQTALPFIASYSESPAPADLVEVVEVDGQPGFAEEALNLAIQFHFPSREEAIAWGDRIIAPLRGMAFERFGESVMPFGTILRRGIEL